MYFPASAGWSSSAVSSTRSPAGSQSSQRRCREKRRRGYDRQIKSSIKLRHYPNNIMAILRERSVRNPPGGCLTRVSERGRPGHAGFQLNRCLVFAKLNVQEKQYINGLYLRQLDRKGSFEEEEDGGGGYLDVAAILPLPEYEEEHRLEGEEEQIRPKQKQSLKSCASVPERSSKRLKLTPPAWRTTTPWRVPTAAPGTYPSRRRSTAGGGRALGTS